MSATPSKQQLDDQAIRSHGELPDVAAWLANWHSDYLLLRLDERDRIAFIGPSVREILGYEPSELRDRPYDELFQFDHPLQGQLQDLSQRLDAGQLGWRRCVAHRRDGQAAFLSLCERTLTDAAGRARGREILAQDETVHIRAELSLRESEKKYRRLVDGLKGDYIIYSHDPAGELTYVSPSVQHVLGYKPSQLLGRNWREFVGQANLGRDLAEQVESEVAAGKRFHKLVIEIQHAAGGTRIFDIQERPTFDLDGSYASMEGIAKDITEAKRRDAQLKQFNDELERRVAQRTAELQRSNQRLAASEARYRDVVENQTEFIVRWLPDGARTFVNDAYCRYFGKSRAELIGTTFLPLIVEEDRQAVRRRIGQLRPESPVVAGEHRVSRPDGSIGWNQWIDRAFFDPHGKVVEYQSVGRDVTALRESADQLREKEAHLAHVSRLATMGELVASIAHEVHQPLHAAKTFAEAARRNLQSNRPDALADAVDCMREVSNEVTRTAQIIRRIREYTRSRSIEKRDVDVNQVVQEAIDVMAHDARRAGIELRRELAQRLPHCRGDRVQIQQVCVNLMKNAVEASADGPSADSTITIRTEGAVDFVRISVIDRGCGVAEADPVRLFDAFYTTKEGGMGMGLSMCSRIAEAHEGRIQWSANAEEPGMTFAFTLPAVGGPKL